MELCFANELLIEAAEMRKAFCVIVARKEREGAQEEEEVIQVADLADNMWHMGQEGMKEVLQNYESLFKPITTLPPLSRKTFKIVLKEGPTPNYRPCRTLIVEVEELTRQITVAWEQEWMSILNAEFTSPVLLVLKQNGQLRICIDYRSLNNITVKDRYPIPNIDDLLQQLKGVSWCNRLVLTRGYHQVAVHNGDRHQTAFTTKFGTCEWNVLPFGLCNGAWHFIRMLKRIL